VFRKTFNLTSDVRGFVRYFSSERQILYRLRHPNIVSYLDFDEDPDQNSLILYLEYCDRGDLTQLHGLPYSSRVSSDKFPCEEDDGSSSGEDDIEFGFYSAEQLPLSQTTPLKGAETWSLIYQLSSALAYLHYGLSIKQDNVGYTASFETSWEYILHRDIKPANGQSIMPARFPASKH
jgi:serine/threonine protein kinase